MQALNILRSSIISRSQSLIDAAGGNCFSNIFRSFSPMYTNVFQPILSGENWMSLNAVRHRKKQPRDYWQRPCERKRLKNAGWRVRMLTESGRRIIMRRILKGKHILSH